MKRFRLLFSALTLVSVLSASEAYASAPTWSVDATTVQATNGGIAGGQVTLLSCVSPGNCLSGGLFRQTSGDVETFFSIEIDGTWGYGRFPSHNYDPPGLAIYGLQCLVSTCVAVGGNSSGPAIVTYDLSSQTASTHTDSLASGNDSASSSYRDVACTSVGNCAAVGYAKSTGPITATKLLVTSEVNGTWESPQVLPLPGTATANPNAVPGQVGCISQSRCVFVGTFANADGATRPFIVIRSNGVWQSAVSPTLPSNASPLGSQTLSELSCVSNGTCTAVGTYHTTAGTLVPYSVTITPSTIGVGTQIPLPPNAAPAPKAMNFGFHGVDCSSVGNCSLGGQYSYQVGSQKKYGGFLTSEVNGVWNPRAKSTFMQVPAGALNAGQFGGAVGMSCWSAGNCVAAVAYVDSAQRYLVGIDLETNGTWAAVTPIPMPNGDAAGAAGGLYALKCFSATSCSGVGSYGSLGNGGSYPFHLNSH